jgi:hypothetical protein
MDERLIADRQILDEYVCGIRCDDDEQRRKQMLHQQQLSAAEPTGHYQQWVV